MFQTFQTSTKSSNPQHEKNMKTLRPPTCTDLGAVSDSTTEGHPVGWCQSRGITSGDQHIEGSPVEMSLLCKKLGLPSKACYQVWVLGLQMNKYVHSLWWYSITWRMNQLEEELPISVSRCPHPKSLICLRGFRVRLHCCTGAAKESHINSNLSTGKIPWTPFDESISMW